jgi:hypothetical protein
VPTATTVTVSDVTLSAVSAAVTAAASLCPQHLGAGLLLVVQQRVSRHTALISEVYLA